MRPAREALITGSDDLVDQIAVEIDGERQRERKPGPHSQRIGFERLRHKFFEFGKILNVIFDYVKGLVVNTRNEAHIVVSGQAPLEPALQAKRPGRRHGLVYFATRWKLDTAQESDQCRFAGAVTPE